ncbi:MAG TPA: histidine ammonia-lyase [Candidatus Angelobacter sp.]|jgi:histidine ammonia-lyase
MSALQINGNDLSLNDLCEVVYEQRPVELADGARIQVVAAREVVEKLLRENRVAYAINTGVGKLSDVHIEPAQNRQLQVNLIRSHSAGVGEPLSQEETRAMMLLRANSLAKGFSGVRPEVIDLLCAMLNKGVHPVVPSQGSVGASGDLAPLAHLALVMIGEGRVWIENAGQENACTNSAEALQRAGIKPLVPEAKEAISLINGTQAMLAVGTLSLLAAENLTETADVLGAMSLDALHGTDVAFDARIHDARPHAGQTQVADNLRRLLKGSEIRESHKDCGRVQDAYSLRCIPQVHGAVRDTLAFCRRTFEIEMNSAVDNPLVFVTGHGEGDIISGGNFHGQPLAFALDYLAIALSALTGISERRIERLVNPALNEGLPPFLAPEAGINSGFMMPQVTAAALASENKGLAHPASVDSITTSGNKEDYVSMGMAAAIKLKRVIANATNVLAIEACAAAQALDFLSPLKSSQPLQKAHAAIRKVSPKIEHDRVFAEDFAKLADLIRAGALAK